MRRSNLLVNEYPLVFSPTLAVLVGLEEAIVLQQIHFWLDKKQELNDQRTFREGRLWVYNSANQWRGQFPFWRVRTIQRILARLAQPFSPKEDDQRVERGPLLQTANFNAHPMDRTPWH